jgi:hypothetical protein
MLQRSGRVAGLVEPCLPSPAKAPPAGADWLHEIKRDGFHLMARRDAKGVRLYTRTVCSCPSYSITSSASASSVGGMVRPRVLAVLTLITSSNLTACWTGMSDGFSPLRIRPL